MMMMMMMLQRAQHPASVFKQLKDFNARFPIGTPQFLEENGRCSFISLDLASRRIAPETRSSRLSCDRKEDVMADGGGGSYDEEEVPMTAEEESAFAPPRPPQAWPCSTSLMWLPG